MIRKISVLVSVIFSAGMLSAWTAHAGTPGPPPPMMMEEPRPIADDGCTFPEPSDAVCSGQHPGDATTETRVFGQSVGQQSKIVGRAAGSRGRGGSSALADAGNSSILRVGGAAGDDWGSYSAWLAFSRTDTENDLSTTRFDADTNIFMLGVDRVFMDKLVLGVSFGIEDTDVDTTFNAGRQEVGGFTIAPYVAYQISPNVSIDASVGYASVDIDQTRLDSTNLTSTIIGNTEATRWFGSVNVNAAYRYGSFLVGGFAGLLIANEDIDAIVERGGPDAFTSAARDLDLKQFDIGVEVTYLAGAFEPYAALSYENEFDRTDIVLNPGQVQPANDDDNFRFLLGLRYIGKSGFSASLEYDVEMGRDDIDSHTFAIVGSYAF